MFPHGKDCKSFNWVLNCRKEGKSHVTNTEDAFPLT